MLFLKNIQLKSNKVCFHSCALACTCQSCHKGSHCYANKYAFNRKGCYTYRLINRSHQQQNPKS